MIVTYNNTENSWSFEQEGTYAERFQFNFVEDGEDLVVFDNLSFGGTLSHIGSNKKLEFSFPSEGVQYVSTEEGVVEVFDIEGVVNGERYIVEVWCENAGKRSEYSYEFTARILPSKIHGYDSWVWSEEDLMWVPPVPHPDDEENFYSWDEESLSWKIFEGVLRPTSDIPQYKDVVVTPPEDITVL